MGAGASASAHPPPFEDAKAKLLEKLSLDALPPGQRNKVQENLLTVYNAAGGDGIFELPAASQAQVRSALEEEGLKLRTSATGTREDDDDDAAAAAAAVNNSAGFRKRRLSLGVQAQPPAVTPTQQHKSRRPSIEFRSPQFPEPTASSLMRKSSMSNKLMMRPSQNTIDKDRTNKGEKAPWPETVLGTWSYHGIEPGYYGRGTVAKINQDRGCVVYPYARSERRSLVCVFDGHGQDGQEVSEFAVEHIVEMLEDHGDLETDPAKALIETFKETDDMLRRSNVEGFYSGTTAVAVYRDGNRLYTANCGDSRAIVGRRLAAAKLEVIPLSIDQNPNLPLERQRIEAAGGFVSDPPDVGLSSRVWLDPECTQVGLAMARSIGDHAVAAVGVIAEPEVLVHDLKANDEFMIAASDGVWEFISSEEALALVDAELKKSKTARAACDKLIRLAIDRWHDMEGDYRDDITCIVLKLSLF